MSQSLNDLMAQTKTMPNTAEKVNTLVFVYNEAKEQSKAASQPWDELQTQARNAIAEVIEATGIDNYNAELTNGKAFIRAAVEPKPVFDSNLLEKLYQDPNVTPDVKMVLAMARSMSNGSSATLVVSK